MKKIKKIKVIMIIFMITFISGCGKGEIQTLNLKGNQSIIVSISTIDAIDRLYVIELYEDGVIETQLGYKNLSVKKEKFSGVKSELFSKVESIEKRQLKENEKRNINSLINDLDLTKLQKYTDKKSIKIGMQGAAERMLWMNRESYYVYSRDAPIDKYLSELIEKIIEYSPIEVKIYSTR